MENSKTISELVTIGELHDDDVLPVGQPNVFNPITGKNGDTRKIKIEKLLDFIFKKKEFSDIVSQIEEIEQKLLAIEGLDEKLEDIGLLKEELDALKEQLGAIEIEGLEELLESIGDVKERLNALEEGGTGGNGSGLIPDTSVPRKEIYNAVVPNSPATFERVHSVTEAGFYQGYVTAANSITAGGINTGALSLDGTPMASINVDQGQSLLYLTPWIYAEVGQVIRLGSGVVAYGGNQIQRNGLYYLPAKAVLPPTVDPMKFTPHKWVVGTEYDFGDGTFGKRYTGNLSVAMNTPLSTVLDSAFTGIKISKSGGDWDLGNSGRQSVKGTAITGTPGNISISFSSTIFINGVNLYINTFVAATTRTNAPYDVWVIYTKG